MSIALVFPGQGSQAVGMGKALAEAYPAARAAFAEVDDALGEKLTDIMWNGQAETLTMTRNAQPALMAVSMAAMRVLAAEGVALPGKVAFAAGHSLGEYSALAAAGSLSLGDAARLLRIRGTAMQDAVPVGQGAMAAILGLEAEGVKAAIAEATAAGGICDVANDNGGGQIVISGEKDAVARAGELAKARGAKRVLPLPVSAPFHSRMMAPAASVMEAALAEVKVEPPKVPVVANVLAAPVTDPAEIRRRLVEQVTGMVRWRESIDFLSQAGVDCFIEVGSGKVLSGLARRIAPNAAALTFGTPEELGAALDKLR
jgi:[acyl-carrier-protein] S-malonyltransferase